MWVVAVAGALEKHVWPISDQRASNPILCLIRRTFYSKSYCFLYFLQVPAGSLFGPQNVLLKLLWIFLQIPVGESPMPVWV